MTTAATTLLGLALPVTGELSGTWGDTVNNSITNLLDTAVAGTTTLSTDVDVTLTTTTLASNQARQAILLCSGARTALRTITAPAQSKIYTIINATTGGFSVKLVGVGPTTGVTIVAGESALVAWNGSDFIKISNTGGSASFTNVTVSGTTTLSGLTASTALALDGSKNVVSVTNTGSGNNVLATSPTLTTPNLGTPSALTLTNATGLPLSTGVTGTLATTNGGTGLTSFTANGVVYASSTSALATGSALTFDGSNFKLTGSDNNNLVYSANSNGTASIRMQSNAAGNYLVAAGPDPLYFQNGSATGVMVFAPASSTEAMRLTSIGLGIGTSSPVGRLSVIGSDNTTQAVFSGAIGTTGRGLRIATSLIASNNEGAILDAQATTGSATLIFQTASTERMRLDTSGNLGIGTTSPSRQLDVKKTAIFDSNGDGTTTNPSIAIGSTSVGFSYLGGSQLAFITNSAEKMRLDSSGNLGLGVTPSGTTRMQVLSSGNNLAYFQDASAAGVQYAIATNGSGQIKHFATWANSGVNAYHSWYVTTTAGAQSQVMTLDVSGNLALGRTSASVLLDMEASGGAAAYWRRTGYSNRGTINVDGTNTTVASEGALIFGAGTSFAERARIDSSGNLGIGTSSPINILDINAASPRVRVVAATGTNSNLIQLVNTGGTAYIGLDNSTGASLTAAYALNLYHTGAYPIVFSTSNTERARIDSSGNMVVGNTSANGKFSVYSGDNAKIVSGFSTASSGYTDAIIVSEFTGYTPNTTGPRFLYCGDTTAARATIRSNGGIANYQANDVNLSDRREKTNFAPAGEYLSKICAIPVQTFNYIDQAQDDPGLTLGVVAQDVQAVAPELVMESNWGTEENPKMRLSIYQTDLQYALMKCIQEQQALIQQLTARVAQLEAKGA